MKSKKSLTIITTVLIALGLTTGIYNYTDDDILIIEPCITESGELSQDTIVIEKEDILKHSYKKFGKRSIQDSLVIVYHHSVTNKKATAHDLARIHVKDNNWPGTGYHFGINYKGDILLLNDLETLGYHARGSNTIGIGMVMIGNYEIEQPSDEMIKSIKFLTKALKDNFKISKGLPHNKVKGASTLCPGKFLEKKLEEDGLITRVLKKSEL